MLIEEISHDPALKSLLKDNRLFISILENLNSGVALIDKTGSFLLYGGDIWVDSKAGEGSKFIFTLPLKLPDACN